jgi:hypothetical protein
MNKQGDHLIPGCEGIATQWNRYVISILFLFLSRSNRDVTSFPRNRIVGTDRRTNQPTDQPTQSLIEVLFAPKNTSKFLKILGNLSILGIPVIFCLTLILIKWSHGFDFCFDPCLVRNLKNLFLTQGA